MIVENRIKERRKARGLTLKQLAELIGASNQQISHLENGRRRLSVEWMHRIAEALECQPSDLLVEPGKPHDVRERAIIELFREMSEEQQEAFMQAMTALAKLVKLRDEAVVRG
ncbi:helix-turn-helix domain-containing protein [Thalassospira xiamenensis]|uniref:DNA-binding transcriptional regulator, XRE family n=1 Tax=Thalassospira xiamenensis TaxID=220697 RepID=A0A285TP83_9PROT|nr:helix-turn-helix transcriptional regulator [Thalassospira xiamenensis]SOC24567.1 DNA-binding transcriptional regulator, XRE family [Thalassospira xiamenensis]